MRGYDIAQIAKKTGLTNHYVSDLSRLIEQGEERLLQAVEAGQIPISIAVEIAQSDDCCPGSALHSACDAIPRKSFEALRPQQVKEVLVGKQRAQCVRGKYQVIASGAGLAYQKPLAVSLLPIRLDQRMGRKCCFALSSLQLQSNPATPSSLHEALDGHQFAAAKNLLLVCLSESVLDSGNVNASSSVATRQTICA